MIYYIKIVGMICSMKKINKKITVMVFIVLALLIIGLFLFNLTKKNSLDDYKYLITYRDMLTPGNGYSIYVFEDYDITVVRQPYCSTPECISGEKTIDSETYEIKLSNRNKEKFERFIKLLFLNKNEKEIKIGYENVDNITGLDKNSINVIYAITLNNEIYFDEYNTDIEIIFDSSICSGAIEDIYVEDEYICSFPCMKSEHTKIKINNKEYFLMDILNNKVYTIDELNDKGLGCYKK